MFCSEKGDLFHAHRIKDCNSLTLTNAVLSLSTAQIRSRHCGFWMQNQHPSQSHAQTTVATDCFKLLLPKIAMV